MRGAGECPLFYLVSVFMQPSSFFPARLPLSQSASARSRLLLAVVASSSIALVVSVLGSWASPTIARAADVGCPTASGSLSGDGVTVPFSVDDSADLQLLKDDSSYWDDSFVQTADIDMGGCIWDRGIARGGSTFPEFSGVYDGGGYGISGLTVSSSLNISYQTGVGLFSRVSGTIRGLRFAGQVNGTATSNGYVGGLVGWLDGGAIEGSSTSGDVTSVYTDTNFSGTGGLVGRADGGATISGSHATGAVSALSESGGLVGRASNSSDPSVSVLESYATGDVEATARLGTAGGLIGSTRNAQVERAFATGDVSGVADAQHLGGLLGSMSNTDVVDSFATGGVSGWTQSTTTYGQVGGLVGDGTGGSNAVTRAYSATLSGMAPSSGTAFASVGGVAGVVATTTWVSVTWNAQTAPLVVNPIGSTASVPGLSSHNTIQMTTLGTYTDPAGLNWNSGGAQTITAGYDVNYTWGICSAVNGGYPFLTATYAVNPCASAPTAPQNPVATGGNASATVAWTAPVSDGGSTLTGYTVTANPGGQTCTSVPPTTTCTVMGLSNGTSYTFDVTATNAVGTSTAATSNAVTPTNPTPPPTYPPSEPLNVAAVGGDASGLITWSVPASSGSFAITDYRAVLSPGGKTCLVGAPNTSCMIQGLTNGTTYSVVVQALNGAGWGPYSAPPVAFTPESPEPPVTKTMVISGSRAIVRGRDGVTADGLTTGLVGVTVQARVHLAGELDYYDGSRRVVNGQGDFTWRRITGKKVYVYFIAPSEGVRSNRIVISAE